MFPLVQLPFTFSFQSTTKKKKITWMNEEGVFNARVPATVTRAVVKYPTKIFPRRARR